MLREKFSIIKNVQGAIWSANNPIDAWRSYASCIKGDNIIVNKSKKFDIIVVER